MVCAQYQVTGRFQESNSFPLSFSFLNKEKERTEKICLSYQLTCPAPEVSQHRTCMGAQAQHFPSDAALCKGFSGGAAGERNEPCSRTRAPLAPESCRPCPGPGRSPRAGRQREPHLSPAEPALAGRNLTILIYQIDKILSLQLRGYVINCVLITAAATSSECSNLRRNRGRCFKLVCVNSASANSAACAAPGAAVPVPGARAKAEAPRLPACLALVASGNPSGGRELQTTLPQTHRPGAVPRAAGLSPAPQALLAERRFKEPLPTPGLRGSSSPRSGCCVHWAR